MWFLRYALCVLGLVMLMTSLSIIANDVLMLIRYRRRIAAGAVALEPHPIRWRTTVALAFLAWAPLVIALSIAVTAAAMNSPAK
ncbi:MAG TPA: hypothetical protein VN577_21645 [Terriglobales bacterium]|nr:hypothetical protein [Terriglobales bacterium]